MGNGHGPPKLSDSDYQTIKTGTCITGGDYDGSIKVGSTYYWMENGDTDWILHSDALDDDKIVRVTDGVWDKCKDGGTWTWVTRGEYWDSGRDNYRWDGEATEDIVLVAV
jgi:hypothetical protein